MNQPHLPVYLVDDEQEVRESLKFLLDSYGLEVVTFSSGKHFSNIPTLHSRGVQS